MGSFLCGLIDQLFSRVIAHLADVNSLGHLFVYDLASLKGQLPSH